MGQPKWNKYEAALLVDMYFKIKDNIIDRKTAVSKLSQALRQMAINNGLDIDDIYRNENGINMRLYEIDGILTEGQYGIKSTSNLFKKTVWLYLNINSSFQIILDEAKTSLYSNQTASVYSNLERTNQKHETLGKIYQINPEFYGDLKLDKTIFSVRTFNGLKRASINTMADLLNITPKELASIKNIGARSVKEIITYLSTYKAFESDSIEEGQKASRLLNIIGNIPEERLNNLTIGYVNAYSACPETRNKLLKYYTSNSTLKDIAINEVVEDYDDWMLVCKFLTWCSFDLCEEIQKIFEELNYHVKKFEVIKLRSNGNTLQDVGDELGVTRERVRQIEAKATRLFSQYEQKYNILLKIVAVRNNDIVLTPEELKEYFRDYTEEAVLLLKNYNEGIYYYDKSLNVFIVGDDSFSSEIELFVDLIPDMFNKHELNYYISKAIDNNLNKELVIKQINSQFNLSGETYHRYRITLSAIYEFILKKYFSNGIKVYDEEELNCFRNYVYNEFGELNLPKQNRAISARLSDNCILCGRGIYKPKQESYISKELLDNIHSYIINSQESVFLTNTIYAIFQDQLEKENVCNKYYLQGILRESFGDEFYFRRDLLSKESNITSIYAQIIDYIKTYKKPISKEKIKERFPGITEIVINMAIQDDSILNYFGEYLHTDNLKIDTNDKEYLELVLSTQCDKKSVLHSRDIFEFVKQDNPGIIGRLKTAYPYCLFSILEYLFKDNYTFQRPYIAKLGIEINKANDIIEEYVSNTEVEDIDNLLELTKELHYAVYSILDFLNSLNNNILIIDNNRIASCKYIGIDETICHIIENTFEDEILSTVPIRNLISIYNLPMINVPWTDWLIYSIINKWSSKYEVATTSNQFRLSIPVIAPKGQLNLDIVESTCSVQSKFEIKVDDLTDLDSLEFDFSEEDF